MRTLGVESDQIVEQLIVEQIHVGEQQILIVSRKLVLKTALKTFDMGVHLWCLGIGQPAAYLALCYFHIKCGLKLTTVI